MDRFRSRIDLEWFFFIFFMVYVILSFRVKLFIVG